MKVLTVVGARPQFIKAAMMSRAFAADGDIEEVLVHTGQHYDFEMSKLFFDELSMRDPAVNLGISGGSHASMTARMMMALETVMVEQQPDWVLLYGDTNSTLAGALTAAKLYLPFCHAEAGPRTFCKTNPEELNRICTDHLATLDCAPTPGCLVNLEHEGLEAISYFTGDLMYDAFKTYASSDGPVLPLIDERGKQRTLPESFYYLTCHREENCDEFAFDAILSVSDHLDAPVVYPMHPRMRELYRAVDGDSHENLIVVKPTGYRESLALTTRAIAVITDSGGLQREAFFAEKKCVTLLPFPSVDETLAGSRNTLVPAISTQAILDALAIPQVINPDYHPFGLGNAADEIKSLMKRRPACATD